MTSPTVVAAVGADLMAEFFTPADVERLRAAARALGGDFARADALADIEDLRGARVVVTSWGAPPFDAGLLDGMPRLRLVAHTGASVKAFVTDELFDRGIGVTQAGLAMARPVAEVSLTFTLALLHRVVEMDHALHTTGGWYDPAVGPQHQILGAPIAVIGASRTGRAYLQLVHALGARVLLVDPTVTSAEAARLGAEKADLDDALRRARIVALHAPTVPETHHLIGARELALMPDGAGLVNTARSWLVDGAALEAELRGRRISAALDVFDSEPLEAGSALRALPNVLLTPHRAAGTVEGRLDQGRIVADEVEAFAAGRPLRHRITRDRLAVMG
ncbi:hydroxyacid dehydrogenase [Microbacterium kyungheense]|uniref:Phosphoglycerate dehydrogenase-like enzyme n=1 Tax=Microbacterium kyungheense TaxID=1263636 RepID=A0A543EDJ0_9MICO|nr:hydroxyacid dehydrogenase [Microbacterium kyungheense]TQM19660.1 phosphoglycerate dehydrogenase-like enzyme [Microbacterium kyungheense]